MKQKIQIKCKLEEGLILGLAGIRENAGHDDSLPYQADLYLSEGHDDNGNPVFSKVGTVYNTGHGGMSCVSADYTKGGGRENAKRIDRANACCQKHTIIYKGKPLTKYSIDYLCDMMAESFLFIGASNRKKDLYYLFDDDPLVAINGHKGNVFAAKPVIKN